MGSLIQMNRQTVAALFSFLIFLWTLSMFAETSPKSLTHITHEGPAQTPVAVPKHGNSKGRPVNVPGPDVSRPDKSPQFTLPPWYEDDDDKAALADPRPSKSYNKGSKETSAVDSPSKSGSPSKSSKPASSPSRDRALILYAYAESAAGLENLDFFVKQGLHDAADFIFILNGETNVSTIIPEKPNIKVINRPNTCFDLGAFGEILRKDDLYKKYKKFITMNASIRGPFLPHWAQACWSDLYLDRLTDKVKLVGMTANCWPRFHVQSMIWATDAVGIELLLNPPKSSSVNDHYGTEDDPVAMAGCYEGWNQAVHAEVGSTDTFLKSGYEVDLMMSAFHKSKKYIEECDTSQNGDVLWNGKYFGTNVHPYETIFIKANRDIDPVLIEHLTAWQQASGFNSYTACSASN